MVKKTYTRLPGALDLPGNTQTYAASGCTCLYYPHNVRTRIPAGKAYLIPNNPANCKDQTQDHAHAMMQLVPQEEWEKTPVGIGSTWSHHIEAVTRAAWEACNVVTNAMGLGDVKAEVYNNIAVYFVEPRVAYCPVILSLLTGLIRAHAKSLDLCSYADPLRRVKWYIDTSKIAGDSVHYIRSRDDSYVLSDVMLTPECGAALPWGVPAWKDTTEHHSNSGMFIFTQLLRNYIEKGECGKVALMYTNAEDPISCTVQWPRKDWPFFPTDWSFADKWRKPKEVQVKAA